MKLDLIFIIWLLLFLNQFLLFVKWYLLLTNDLFFIIKLYLFKNFLLFINNFLFRQLVF
jgi:hypothetical protein